MDIQFIHHFEEVEDSYLMEEESRFNDLEHLNDKLSVSGLILDLVDVAIHKSERNQKIAQQRVEEGRRWETVSEGFPKKVVHHNHFQDPLLQPMDIQVINHQEDSYLFEKEIRSLISELVDMAIHKSEGNKKFAQQRVMLEEGRRGERISVGFPKEVVHHNHFLDPLLQEKTGKVTGPNWGLRGVSVRLKNVLKADTGANVATIPREEEPIHNPTEVATGPGGSYACTACTYVSPKKWNVKNHIRYKHSSTSQRDWICPNCDAHFVEKKGLQRHAPVCRGRGAPMLGRPVGGGCKEKQTHTAEEGPNKRQKIDVGLQQEDSIEKKMFQFNKFAIIHDLAAMATIETAVGPIGKCSNVLHAFRYLACSCLPAT